MTHSSPQHLKNSSFHHMKGGPIFSYQNSTQITSHYYTPKIPYPHHFYYLFCTYLSISLTLYLTTPKIESLFFFFLQNQRRVYLFISFSLHNHSYTWAQCHIIFPLIVTKCSQKSILQPSTYLRCTSIIHLSNLLDLGNKEFNHPPRRQTEVRCKKDGQSQNSLECKTLIEHVSIVVISSRPRIRSPPLSRLIIQAESLEFRPYNDISFETK